MWVLTSSYYLKLWLSRTQVYTPCFDWNGLAVNDSEFHFCSVYWVYFTRIYAISSKRSKTKRKVEKWVQTYTGTTVKSITNHSKTSRLIDTNDLLFYSVVYKLIVCPHSISSSNYAIMSNFDDFSLQVGFKLVEQTTTSAIEHKILIPKTREKKIINCKN